MTTCFPSRDAAFQNGNITDSDGAVYRRHNFDRQTDMRASGDNIVEIRLEKGLWLEARGTCLPWGSTISDLRMSAPPDFCVAMQELPSATLLAWNDQVWDGLRCQVSTTFGGTDWSQSALRAFRLVVWTPADLRPFSAHFRWLQAELCTRLGSPLSHWDNGDEGEACWQVGGVTIRHEYLDWIWGGRFVYVYHRESDAEGYCSPSHRLVERQFPAKLN